ncbi:hypothetical protein A3K73_04485 [Candidatus Pacearchaeota archaeon RBG_13_36_9]|nr:MAG: hypothetical protein A3K73_04485 [Candidatus Pacearchaeota archaeon RBG_13_36_9]
MKRGRVVAGFAFSVFLIVVLSVMVSAQATINFDTILKGITDVLSVVFGSTSSITFGDATYQVEEVLVAKILLSIILFALLWNVFSFMPFLNIGWSRTLASIIVTLLGVRLLNAGWIYTILLPYGALAISITAIIPFIIYFFFVEKGITSSAGRKVAWVFFIVVFAMLWALRVFYIKDGGLAIGTPQAFVYPIACVVALIMLLMDKTIHAWFVTSSYSRLRDATKAAQVNEINLEVDWAGRVIATTPGNPLPPRPYMGFTPPSWAAGNKTNAMDADANRFIKDKERAIKKLLKS